MIRRIAPPVAIGDAVGAGSLGSTSASASPRQHDRNGDREYALVRRHDCGHFDVHASESPPPPVTIRPLGRRNTRPMSFLIADQERYALRPGRNTLGGRGADAVTLTSLAGLAPAAVITIRPDGTALIQRISAAVIVKVDGGPLGALPH